jgi:DNA-directed RNA polymerase specialized sigma24 family protein
MPAVDSLIEKARRGDRMALDRLLIEHAEPLRVHLLRGLPSRVKGLISVEDVVQETLAKAFLKIDRFRGESRHAFAAWLLAIGDMTLIDLVRRETRQARGGQFERQEFASDSVKGSLVDLLAQLPGEEKTGSQIVAHEEGVAALQVAIAEIGRAHV